MGSRWGRPVVLRGSGTPETSATARNAPVCRRPKGRCAGSNEVGGCYSGRACHCHRQEVPAVIPGGALSSRSGEVGVQPETVPTGAVEKNLGVLPGVMGSPPESRQDEPRQVGGTRRPASAAGSDGDHDCHGDGGPFWGLPGLHIAVPHPGFPLSFRAIPRRSRRPSFWECCRFFSGPGGQGALVGRGGILGTGLTERGRQQEFSPGDWDIESGLAERVGVEEFLP